MCIGVGLLEVIMTLKAVETLDLIDDEPEKGKELGRRLDNRPNNALKVYQVDIVLDIL